MKFLYPGFLWALLTVLIPIIIHLFNFRRYKTIYFSNVAFLQNIRKETKSRSRLKNLLLLLIRILSIVFLVLAFARPYFVDNNKAMVKRQNVVGVYIDNSFSMEASGKFGILFENAKMKAHEIANSYNYSTKYLLTTNNFELKHQQLVNKDQFVDWVSQIKTTHIIRTIDEVESLQQQVMGNIDSLSTIHQYILSDFQKNIFDISAKLKSNISQQYLVNFENSTTNNIYIDSVWFKTPGQHLGKQEKLMVSLWNKSNNELTELQINLYINDSLKALSTVNILPNKNEIIEMPFVQTKPGVNNAKVELNDYPITFDNEFFFSYNLTKKLNVLQIINGIEVNYLKALYETDDNFTYTEIDHSNIDYEAVSQYHVIIINGLSDISSGLINLLSQQVANGTRLVIIPPKQCNENHYQELLNKLEGVRFNAWREEKGNMQKLELDHQFFKEAIKKADEKIRLPEYEGYYSTFSNAKSNDQTILESESGKPIIIQESFNKGDYILFTVPISEGSSNLATHPIAVPLFYNLALYSHKTSDLYFTLTPKLNISFKENNFDGVLKLLSLQDNTELLPQTIYGNNTLKVFINEQAVKAGYYELKSDNEKRKAIALNYNRVESDMVQYSEKELKAYANNQDEIQVNVIKGDQTSVNAEILQSSRENTLSSIFLCLLAFGLVAEMLVLRLVV